MIKIYISLQILYRINSRIINKNKLIFIKDNEVIMPRDFKSFVDNNKKVIDENKDKINEYQEIINKYKDMNQNDLMKSLFDEANKLKREGKLDGNTLSNLKQTISPFLNNEQKKMLDELLIAINNS